MQSQTKEAMCNLSEAIGKRRELQQHLEIRLEGLKARVIATESQITLNQKHLSNLDSFLDECKNMKHLSPGKIAVLSIRSKLEKTGKEAKKELELASEMYTKEMGVAPMQHVVTNIPKIVTCDTPPVLTVQPSTNDVVSYKRKRARVTAAAIRMIPVASTSSAALSPVVSIDLSTAPSQQQSSKSNYLMLIIFLLSILLII